MNRANRNGSSRRGGRRRAGEEVGDDAAGEEVGDESAGDGGGGDDAAGERRTRGWFPSRGSRKRTRPQRRSGYPPGSARDPGPGRAALSRKTRTGEGAPDDGGGDVAEAGTDAGDAEPPADPSDADPSDDARVGRTLCPPRRPPPRRRFARELLLSFGFAWRARARTRRTSRAADVIACDVSTWRVAGRSRRARPRAALRGGGVRRRDAEATGGGRRGGGRRGGRREGGFKLRRIRTRSVVADGDWTSPFPVSAAASSDDGARFAVGTTDGSILLFDASLAVVRAEHDRLGVVGHTQRTAAARRIWRRRRTRNATGTPSSTSPRD